MARRSAGGSFADSLTEGVRTGLLLGRATKDRKARHRTQDLLGIEADIDSWTPPTLDTGGEAIPSDQGGADPATMDGREALTQGYSGDTMRALVDRAAAAAAEIGDPGVYADSRGRVLDSLTRRFQSHMSSGANLLNIDPAAAVEQFSQASAYILDGNVPQFNVITAADGTPIAAHTLTDPKTGKQQTTMLTLDMLNSIMMSQGTMQGFVAGTSGIRSGAAARYNDEVEKQVKSWTGKTSYAEGVEAAINSAFDEISPDAGKTTRTVKTWDEATQSEIETEVEVPGYARDPESLREIKGIARSFVHANITTPDEELMRGGASPYSSVDGLQARDLAASFLEHMTNGPSGVMSGLTPLYQDETTSTFRIDGQTVRLPNSSLQQLAEIANKARVGANLSPLPQIADLASAGGPGAVTPPPTEGAIPAPPPETPGAATQPPGAIPENMKR
jgi:hypothetical protein